MAPLGGGIIKFSPSSLVTYYTCPYKFKLAYIDQVKPLPPAEKLVFGSKVHEVLAKYYEIIPETISTKEIPLFLSQAVKEVGGDFKELEGVLRGFCRFEEKRLTWNLNPKPVAVEKYFEKGIFCGVIDAIFRRFDGKLVGVDWKSGKVRLDNVSFIIPGFIYTYIANLDEMIFVPLFSGHEERLTVKELIQFKSVITEILNGIKSEKFEKKETDDCKRCEYSLACKLEEDGSGVSWH
ncbi:MAG: PD-(D/E)XK nuclease family protein [Desulfurococcaceae archaeon]